MFLFTKHQGYLAEGGLYVVDDVIFMGPEVGWMKTNLISRLVTRMPSWECAGLLSTHGSLEYIFLFQLLNNVKYIIGNSPGAGTNALIQTLPS